MEIYTIENDNLLVEIKDDGAELHRVFNKKNGTEYLWNGNTDWWYGQSPILFPIIGRLLDDKYRYDGKEYTMPKHGLFRKRKAAVYEQAKDKISFIETEDEETLEKYPFTFKCIVTFELNENKLFVNHKVINTNDKTMYFSIGAHPAFNCQIGDWLEFSENETLSTEMIDHESIRVAEKFPLLNNENKIIITEHIFDNDALILSGIKSKYITLKSDKHSRYVKFDLNGCPYLGIWAKPGAPYVCIEPWYGVNDTYDKKDCICKKDAIQSLDAKKEFNFDWNAEFGE